MLIGSGTGVRTELVITLRFEFAPKVSVMCSPREYGALRLLISKLLVWESELGPGP
jgi:hypothetical protein